MRAPVKLIKMNSEISKMFFFDAKKNICVLYVTARSSNGVQDRKKYDSGLNLASDWLN